MALLDMYEGKYRDARERLEEAIAISRARTWTLTTVRNHLFLSTLLEGLGDRPGCLKALDMANADLLTLQKTTAAFPARLGIGYARAGATEKAQKVFPQEISFLHLLQGSLALARRDYAGANEWLVVADKEFSTPETVAALADAYDQGGDFEHAAEFYSKLIAGVRPALGWEPQQPWLAAHVRLAELYAASGQAAKASELLDALAAIWKDADRDLPLVKGMNRVRESLRDQR
jgi:tetratricopeptide (TPR) repeat protein